MLYKVYASVLYSLLKRVQISSRMRSKLSRIRQSSFSFESFHWIVSWRTNKQNNSSAFFVWNKNKLFWILQNCKQPWSILYQLITYSKIKMLQTSCVPLYVYGNVIRKNLILNLRLFFLFALTQKGANFV